MNYVYIYVVYVYYESGSRPPVLSGSSFSSLVCVIFDEYLWFYCLFETFENFHEITVYFIDEDKKTEFYTSSKEAYCYFLFSSLSKSILQLTNYPFLLQISETRHNLAPLYFNFKYLGSSHNFLIFNSNN